jgi:hypothetical protein
MDDLSEEDKLTVYRARKVQKFLSQPFTVAEVFTGMQGRFVTLEETISGFEAILSGKGDLFPEQAFYMVGGFTEVESKAKDLLKQSPSSSDKKKEEKKDEKKEEEEDKGDQFDQLRELINTAADRVITAMKKRGADPNKITHYETMFNQWNEKYPEYVQQFTGGRPLISVEENLGKYLQDNYKPGTGLLTEDTKNSLATLDVQLIPPRLQPMEHAMEEAGIHLEPVQPSELEKAELDAYNASRA